VDQRVGGILGYTPSELLGHPCYEFFHPEDLTHMRESFEQGNDYLSRVENLLIHQIIINTCYDLLSSIEIERAGRICNVQISSQESRLGVVEDVCIRVPESLQRGGRIYRLHKHTRKVRMRLRNLGD